MKWTGQEVKILRELVNAGADIHNIARVLKSRTRSAIEHKLRHLNLTIQRPEPEIDLNLFRQLVQAKHQSLQPQKVNI